MSEKRTQNRMFFDGALTLVAVASLGAIAYAVVGVPAPTTVPGATSAPAAAAALPAASSPGDDTVDIAWFLEWSTPLQLAKLDGRVDDEMGVTTRWSNFVSGTGMSEAMLAGDIDIAYSQGLAPFVAAVNDGVPITLVGVALAYGANDDCIVRDDAGITAANATELEGKTVAVPVNTMADFGFRLTLDALGVDAEAVEVLDQDPETVAASLVSGKVVMACAFGAESLASMRTVGSSMLSASEKTEAGITSFDIVSVRDAFLAAHPDRVRAFLRAVHEANARFAEDSTGLDVLAADAGLSVEVAREQLAGFDFPSVEQQRDRYFGENGLVLDMLGFMGHLFATDEAPALGDYAAVVDSSLLD